MDWKRTLFVYYMYFVLTTEENVICLMATFLGNYCYAGSSLYFGGDWRLSMEK